MSLVSYNGSLLKRINKRTFGLVWWPDHPANAILPLHDKYLVANLQSAYWIDAEPAVERGTNQLASHSAWHSILTPTTSSKAASTEHSSCKCLALRIRR